MGRGTQGVRNVIYFRTGLQDEGLAHEAYQQLADPAGGGNPPALCEGKCVCVGG